MGGKVRAAVCIGVVQRERVWDRSPCAGTRCAGSSDSHCQVALRHLLSIKASWGCQIQRTACAVLSAQEP